MPPAPDSLTKTGNLALATVARLLAKTPVRLVFYAALALAATWPLLATSGSLNTYRDSHPLVHYEEAARHTVIDFGQFPLWDPYYCGGLDGLGTPQSRFASPSFLLTLVFGTLRAEPLVAFFMLLLGLEGAFRYARSRGASSLGAGLSAPAFALSGFFAVAPALGWYNFFGFELLPWAAFGLRLAMKGSARGAALAALALGWTVGFGGTYPAPMAALWCAFEVFEFLFFARRDRQKQKVALGMAAVTGALALGIAAVKLWPTAQTLMMAPRIIGGTPGTGPLGISRALLGRIRPDEHGDFAIGGTFLVGGLSALAVGAGVTRKRAIPLTIVALCTLWLAAGYSAKLSLFAALKRLPLYSTLRFPERFLVLFALAACVLAALGMTKLQALGRKRAWAAGVAMLAAGLLLGNVGPLVANHQAAAHGRPMGPPPTKIDGEFRQARGTRWALAYYEPMSRGVLSCYDAYPVPQSRLLRGDLPQEEYLQDPTAGTVKRAAWTPNRIELDVDANKPARLLVNQNWHPGWRSSLGDVVSDKGLLAVDLPAGKEHVTLRFLPRAAVGGVLVTLVSLFAAGFLALRERRGKPLDARGLALFALSPAVPFLAVVALMHEPAVPSVELVTAHGDPVVADAPPPEAHAVGAKFGAGLSLVAFHQTSQNPPPESNLSLELDWKVDPGVETRLGIFVHLVPSTGDDLRADHVMFSDVLEIEKAPTDKILRDVVDVTIPDDAKGKMWTIYVGVWRVRGDGKRIPVTEPGNVKVSEDRLEVGTFYVP